MSHELPKRLGVCGHHSTCSTNPWADRGEVIMGATIALRPCLVRSGRNDATNHFASVHFCSASALPGTIHDMICIRRCSYERASHLPPCLDVFSLWELSRDHAGTALFPVKFLCFVCRLWTLRYLDRLSQCLDFFYLVVLEICSTNILYFNCIVHVMPQHFLQFYPTTVHIAVAV
jgi:hypothetical protein